MIDLKPYLDAVNTADVELKGIANEINALVTDGTEESMTQALALRPKLDQAQNKLDSANAFYEKMKKATMPVNDSVQALLSSQKGPVTPPKAEEPKVLNRAQFDALKPADRMAFAKAGGTLAD